MAACVAGKSLQTWEKTQTMFQAVICTTFLGMATGTMPVATVFKILDGNILTVYY
jgi:hypothetical protein